MTNVIKKSISPICEINPTIQDRNKAVYHLYGSSKACGGFIFVRASHILVPAIYAVFNLARGSCSACFNFPYSRLAPNTTIHVFRGGGDTLPRGRGTFTPQSRNSFSLARRAAEKRRVQGRTGRWKMGNAKRERKFLLPPLGTFLISCVFCQDKLNFYERRRRRRRLRKSKRNRKSRRQRQQQQQKL